jgi:hypothetical protein
MINKPEIDSYTRMMTDPNRWNSDILWICLSCGFYGFGRPVTYHRFNNPNHEIVTEEAFDERKENEKEKA